MGDIRATIGCIPPILSHFLCFSSLLIPSQMCQKKTGDRRYNQKSPVSVGDVVKVLVLDVDEKKKRISLSIRQAK